VNIAANDPITQLIDDVIVTQFGRHTTVNLPAVTDVVVPWPTTGELFMYMTLSSPVETQVGIRPFGAGDSWVFFVEPSAPTSILLPKLLGDVAGDPPAFILNSFQPIDVVSIMFF